MNEPSAPYMRECNECGDVISNTINYNTIIEVFEDSLKKYSNVEDFRAFLENYKINPNLIYNQCEICLRYKLRSLKDKINKKQEQTQNTPLKNNKNTFIRLHFNIIIIIGMILIGFFSSYVISMTGINSKNHLVIREEELKSTIIKLKHKFPSLQQSLLKKIGGAFSRLKTPGEPFVFLLLHDDTNKNTTDCLALYTSIVAKQNIFTNTVKSLWMDGSEWVQYSSKHDDQDILYKKLIVPLKENEVLVLENLQDLPWSLAKPFHYLCDSENPHIAKAMYLLELKVNSSKNLHQLNDREKLLLAEQTLLTAWFHTDVPNSFKRALITRLTSYVDAVLLKSDEGCTNETVLNSENSFIRITP